MQRAIGLPRVVNIETLVYMGPILSDESYDYETTMIQERGQVWWLPIMNQNQVVGAWATYAALKRLGISEVIVIDVEQQEDRLFTHR